MTIYSQHPNRGKVQILATFRGPTGVQSSTVTSVDDEATATKIVSALNRISACATVPLCCSDRRHGGFEPYPNEHLAALTDRDGRSTLLLGTHSLWYEHVKLLLYQALTDLDHATASVPTPVQTAITAELEKEARDLRDALAEYTDGIESPPSDSRREWDSDLPFVPFGGGFEGLSESDRKSLDRLELGATEVELAEGVHGMRLLIDAYEQCSNGEARLILEDLSISDDPDPYGPNRYFLDVLAPLPNGELNRTGWTVELGWWELDPADDAEEEPSSATGETVLRCAMSIPPEPSQIVGLLNLSDGQPEQLRTWAATPVGRALAGTSFVVTKRYTDLPRQAEKAR
ncbi:hypothetical protein ACFQ05_26100 [Amycolatopsis umgeniensis]|uniref:Uncharacterized protein n=1 Tax=Amycolatopsis umgeniensis TaxID=336628 RepID=A0A841BCQ8_9PSEU|nr:hypothetical protein [Amycolatopsis umgeniensis]MBB5856352.1 hypothetical protein [Amycolatopsis umgeniensis]